MLTKKQILLTNDDGVLSPGLWAAAQALEPLGDVLIVAPREQWSGAGRSLPAHSSGCIYEETITVNGQPGKAYAIEGTPAQAVLHGVLELLPRLPDLVVAGINYGENVGTGVTISGTIGAVLEGASMGIPGLAVSLQTDPQYHHSYSTEIDFVTAELFTRKFAQILLNVQRTPDVDVLKVEIPETATPATPWRMTRLSRTRYYIPQKPQREKLTDRGAVGYLRRPELDIFEPESDVQAMLDQVISVTPLSLDLTSRVDLRELGRLLSEE